jgi:hypothetical protein
VGEPVTMAQPNGQTTTITGTVEAVNERGVKVNGGWLNVSQYKPIALPMRGVLVAVEVKDGRWIQSRRSSAGSSTATCPSASTLRWPLWKRPSMTPTLASRKTSWLNLHTNCGQQLRTSIPNHRPGRAAREDHRQGMTCRRLLRAPAAPC